MNLHDLIINLHDLIMNLHDLIMHLSSLIMNLHDLNMNLHDLIMKLHDLIIPLSLNIPLSPLWKEAALLTNIFWYTYYIVLYTLLHTVNIDI